MPSKLLAIIILFFCGVLIAAADAFIKKAAISGSFSLALKNPWLYAAIAFYLIQILLVTYLFLGEWKLGILANVFNIFYSVSAIALAYLFFAEKLLPIQALGVLLGLVGVVLMTK